MRARADRAAAREGQRAALRAAGRLLRRACSGRTASTAAAGGPTASQTLDAGRGRGARTRPASAPGCADGQHVLELGCGWGSLTPVDGRALSGAAASPRVSNSHSQRALHRGRGARGAACATSSVAHPRHQRLRHRRRASTASSRSRCSSTCATGRARSPASRAGCAPDGRFFMHVFAHRGAPYAFVERDASDWMSRHFFSGGMMPSDDLALRFQDDLRLLAALALGRHALPAHRRGLAAQHGRAARRADAAVRGDLRRATPTSGGCAGACSSCRCAELFGYDGGQQWWVSHYLFETRARLTPALPHAPVGARARSARRRGARARDLAREPARGATPAWSTAMWSVFIAARGGRLLRAGCRRPAPRGAVMLVLALAWALRLGALHHAGATGATAKTAATRRSARATSRTSR